MGFFEVTFRNFKSIFHRFLIAPKTPWPPRVFLPPGPELLNLLLQLNYVDRVVTIPLHKQLCLPVFDVSHHTGPTFPFSFKFYLLEKLRNAAMNNSCCVSMAGEWHQVAT